MSSGCALLCAGVWVKVGLLCITNHDSSNKSISLTWCIYTMLNFKPLKLLVILKNYVHFALLIQFRCCKILNFHLKTMQQLSPKCSFFWLPVTFSICHYTLSANVLCNFINRCNTCAGDRRRIVQLWKLQTPRDLDLGSGHTAYRRASVIDLYLHTKFRWNRKKTFGGRTYVRTDGRTYWRTDISPSVIWSTRTSRPKILNMTAWL